MSNQRTLQSLVDTTRTSVGAESALLLAPSGDGLLEIVASSGTPIPSGDGHLDPTGSYSGMVLTSEQPMALQVRPDDPQVAAEAALLGRSPGAICCVPCVGSDDVAGVIELIDKAGGGSFDFDDVEIATMLAEVAGAALEERGGSRLEVPRPEQLSTMLRELADREPDRYERVALLVEMVLAAG